LTNIPQDPIIRMNTPNTSISAISMDNISKAVPEEDTWIKF